MTISTFLSYPTQNIFSSHIPPLFPVSCTRKPHSSHFLLYFICCSSSPSVYFCRPCLTVFLNISLSSCWRSSMALSPFSVSLTCCDIHHLMSACSQIRLNICSSEAKLHSNCYWVDLSMLSCFCLTTLYLCFSHLLLHWFWFM